MSDQNRLGRFIADLATNPAVLKAYKADPEAATSAAGLSEDEKSAVRAGNFRAIVDLLGEGTERPIPDVQPPGG
ncbi:MAG TPA: hypothetical protein VNJ70_03205 [Thermoanaerobaculia bacterium]|nr:hypothetical protein [Thermoanaerobaculia bacterium]